MFATPTRSSQRGAGLDPGTIRALQAAKASGKLSIRNVILPHVPNELWEFEERSFDQGNAAPTDWWESERLTRLHLENCDLRFFAPPPATAPSYGIAPAPFVPNYELIGERFGALQALHVTHNEQLRAFPLAALRLPLLQNLDLSFNAVEEFVSGSTEKSLGDIHSDDIVAPLRNLSLHHNRIGSLSSLRMLMLIDSPWSQSLTKLLLHDNCLTTLPAQLLNLSSLVVLSVARNRLKELPENMGARLQNLRELDASENQLSSWPQSFVLMTNLERLNLRSNRIEYAEESGLPSVPSSVVELFLGNNRIQHILGLQQCHSLATLDLSDNRLDQLVVLGAQPLGSSSHPVIPLHECWPTLQRIDIHNNSLALLPMELGLMERLVSVQVQGNQLPVLVQDMASRELVSWLQKRCQENTVSEPTFAGERQGGQDFTVSEGKLDLSKTQLAAVPIGLLTNAANAEHLTSLRLSQNKVSVLPPQIGLLHNLKVLDLKKNCLSSLPAELGRCQFLEDLDLSQNSLSSVPNDALRHLARLKVLSLAANKFGQAPLPLHGLAASGQTLMHLSLAANKLTTDQIDFDTIVANLVSLKHLDLSTNDLQSVPGSLATLQHLAVLDVQYNQLPMLPIEVRQKTKPVDRRNAPLRLLAYGNLRPESSLLRLPPQ